MKAFGVADSIDSLMPITPFTLWSHFTAWQSAPSSLRSDAMRMFPVAFLFTLTFVARLSAAAPTGEESNTTPIVRLAELDRLAKPYVAQARATYPAAKKRFLAGLPAGYKFLVMLRFFQRDERTGKATAGEDMLVLVERIEKGRVYGRLGNAPVLVKNLKWNDKVSRRESEITNWIIKHPDRSEEGNVVGKFLERHYKLK